MIEGTDGKGKYDRKREGKGKKKASRLELFFSGVGFS